MKTLVFLFSMLFGFAAYAGCASDETLDPAGFCKGGKSVDLGSPGFDESDAEAIGK